MGKIKTCFCNLLPTFPIMDEQISKIDITFFLLIQSLSNLDFRNLRIFAVFFIYNNLIKNDANQPAWTCWIWNSFLNMGCSPIWSSNFGEPAAHLLTCSSIPKNETGLDEQIWQVTFYGWMKIRGYMLVPQAIYR